MKDWKLHILMGVIGSMVVGGAIMIFVYWINPWTEGVYELKTTDLSVPGVVETDSDGDGLSLEKESELGTSDNLRDTDEDLLEDNEELFFQTDPLSSDTDGDGYLDGEEVESDHDPLN